MRFLFIPVSSKKGIGEYMRSLILADAVKSRWPDSEINFVLSKQAPYHADCPYPTHLTEQTPTFHIAEVNTIISEFRPQVVVFDASGRKAQLRHARANGALTVFISQHKKKRSRGLRLDRMWHTDLHWVAQPEFVLPAPGLWSRLKLRLLKKEPPLYLGTLYNQPSEDVKVNCLDRYSLTAGSYLFVSAGSGGHYCGTHGLAADCFALLATEALSKPALFMRL
ncbi:MAG: hypothetical protein IBX50_16175 [Marinospirillum sp.]|uniref:hypothetical protein n=1 Tax=Marinospirillum sp. TaxID=2183934 RepID=UPI0019F0E60B|nr:hypothetical protein [Marinospirillum sp.]MBE0508226.1 hypothetical protein [Marinospirillum sp.]